MTDRDVVERIRERVKIATACRPPRLRQDLPLLTEAADLIERLRSSPDRGAIVEECARVAEEWGKPGSNARLVGQSIAYAIRSLSSPPGRKG